MRLRDNHCLLRANYLIILSDSRLSFEKRHPLPVLQNSAKHRPLPDLVPEQAAHFRIIVRAGFIVVENGVVLIARTRWSHHEPSAPSGHQYRFHKSAESAEWHRPDSDPREHCSRGAPTAPRSSRHWFPAQSHFLSSSTRNTTYSTICISSDQVSKCSCH